jgi:hypothetical protein
MCGSCTAKVSESKQAFEEKPRNVVEKNNSEVAVNKQASADNSDKSEKNSAIRAEACGNFKSAGKNFIKSQSFAFNYEPFVNSCFVTFGSAEEMLDSQDVPRGSTFHIFQKGKEVYEFPDAFGGQKSCWVEGVSFKDLNDDGLTEVIIAGSCLGAKNSYPANAVFINSGEAANAFSTNEEANSKLEKLTKLKDIEAYVVKNKNLFF